jgi:hypothetical protein
VSVPSHPPYPNRRSRCGRRSCQSCPCQTWL